MPEETNRRIVDHTADVNLTYSAIAREYLLRAMRAGKDVVTANKQLLSQHGEELLLERPVERGDTCQSSRNTPTTLPRIWTWRG